MDRRQPGKLKYINGIPYLSGRDVHIEEVPAPSRTERVLLAGQALFGRRFGGAVLVLLLVALAATLGALIDLLFLHPIY
ncbi:MAG: hypothetical protein LPK58_00780 [Gammaproteobacteria bacterium]|nr:hypothetical protein [Gammaproteobacteria bacterium]MDX5374278.1 hypothetical protein [Gammaproteobacteria bacterium]